MITIIVLLVIFSIAGLFIYALSIPPITIPENTTKTDTLEALDVWLEELNANEKFNGSVLLTKGEEIIFNKSYGYEDIKETRLMSEKSAFNLASVSKQFTAMGIVLLKYRNKIGYEDSLIKHIPELMHYEGITIQQLLHHTSGIPDYISLANKYWREPDVLKASDMISLLQTRKPPLRFSSGSKFEYSNTGYVLLAEVIERVSGQSFSQFMSDNIFQPLGMNNTQVFNLLSEDEPENRVFGFKRKYWIFGGDKQLQDLNYFDGVAGDGGIYSSSYDLYLWHNSLINGSLVTNSDYEVAFKSGVLNDGSYTGYGFGWFIKQRNKVEHAGGWQGFTSYVYRDLESNNLIVILDNSSNALRVNSFGYRINSIGLNLQYFLESYK